jgi:hypothetical protein
LMPKIYGTATVQIFLDEASLRGAPYRKLTLQQGRAEATAHLNAAGLLSVAAAMIEQANEMILGKESDGSADNADVGAAEAKAL